jgi:hypothetical protein
VGGQPGSGGPARPRAPRGFDLTDFNPRDDGPFEPFDFDIEDGDDAESPLPSWRDAIGEMIAALLVVLAIVAAFIAAAAVLRRLLPW